MIHGLVSFSLIFSVSLAEAKSKWICEWEISKRARVLSGILFSGVDRGVLQPEDLRKFLAQFPNYDPFSRFANLPETHSFIKSYRELRPRLKAHELEEVRKAANEILQQMEREESTVHQAVDQTAKILVARIADQVQLPSGYIHSSSSSVALGAVDGRPVVSSRASQPQTNFWFDFFYDPFYPRPNARVVEMRTGTDGGSLSSSIFKMGSKTFSAAWEGAHFYDISTRAQARSPFLGLTLSTDSVANNFVQVNSALHGPQLFAYQSSTREGLVQYDLSTPSGKSDLVLEGTILGLRHSHNEGRDYLTFLNDRFRFSIYDVNDRKFIPVDATALGMSEAPGGIVFTKDGDLHLAYGDMSGNLHIQNVRTGTDRPLKTSGSYRIRGLLNFTVINGVPHLYYPGSTSLAFLNLKTEKFSSIPVRDSRFTNFSVFEWKSRKHMIWGSEGRVHIYDLEVNLFAATIPIPAGKFHVTTFSYDEDIYASVLTNTSKIYLIQITGDEK